MRLNGWQRLWVVIASLWTIAISAVLWNAWARDPDWFAQNETLKIEIITPKGQTLEIQSSTDRLPTAAEVEQFVKRFDSNQAWFDQYASTPKYLSTDPNAGQRVTTPSTPPIGADVSDLMRRQPDYEAIARQYGGRLVSKVPSASTSQNAAPTQPQGPSIIADLDPPLAPGSGKSQTQKPLTIVASQPLTTPNGSAGAKPQSAPDSNSRGNVTGQPAPQLRLSTARASITVAAGTEMEAARRLYIDQLFKDVQAERRAVLTRLAAVWGLSLLALYTGGLSVVWVYRGFRAVE